MFHRWIGLSTALNDTHHRNSSILVSLLLSSPALPETLLKCQAVAVGAALSAGEVIETAFHQPKNISHKGDIDLVTETDKACEKLILGRLREEFPTYKVRRLEL